MALESVASSEGHAAPAALRVSRLTYWERGREIDCEKEREREQEREREREREIMRERKGERARERAREREREREQEKECARARERTALRSAAETSDYRGTTLTRHRTPLGPYRGPMPRILGGA